MIIEVSFVESLVTFVPMEYQIRSVNINEEICYKLWSIYNVVGRSLKSLNNSEQDPAQGATSE